MDFNSGYPLTELSLKDIQHILTPDLLSQLSKGISFNGNLGDFGAASDGLEIVEYLVSHNVPVHINTNGSMRSPEWWAKLALPGVSIGFALDGIDQTTHVLYRQDTNWDTVIKNARAFINAGGYAFWRFIPFDHNRDQEAACRLLAEAWGFQEFENIHEGRDHGPVFNRQGDFSHWLGPTESWKPDSRAMVENHVTWFNAKTIKADKDTPVLNINCIHKRQAELYIAADGTVYPCCFLGFYPGQMTHPGNEQLIPVIKENNALEYNLEHCLKWFDQVEESWTKASVNQGRLYGCVNSCNKV
jgi:MoaA/NifB/PqqE/SkfB family radical SAM enzyme